MAELPPLKTERVTFSVKHRHPSGELQFMRHALAEAFLDCCGLGLVADRWIPVEERLPEDDQQCLTVDKDGVQRVARFDAIGDGERHSWYEEQEWKSVYPVAWMPLPKPPGVKA